jgi:hypothetical protein
MWSTATILTTGNGRVMLLNLNPADSAGWIMRAADGETRLSVLDWHSVGRQVSGVVYETHPFVASEAQRNRRKCAKRLIVFGECEVHDLTGAETLQGTITFICDGVREESYPVEGVYDREQGIVIWQECSQAMTGYVIAARLELEGVNLTVRDARLEFAVLD